MSAFDLTLHLHDPPVQRVWSAEGVARCPDCRHHPNAHATGNCAVTIEQFDNGWKARKCGCTAIKKRKAA